MEHSQLENHTSGIFDPSLPSFKKVAVTEVVVKVIYKLEG